jgi:hypothetical protein
LGLAEVEAHYEDWLRHGFRIAVAENHQREACQPGIVLGADGLQQKAEKKAARKAAKMDVAASA